MWGMWVNCIYGGKGVGMINLLLFLMLGDFRRGPDGGPNARVSGQEDRRARDEARDDRAAGPSDHDSRSQRAVRRDELGNEGREQSRPARFFRDRVPVLLGVGQQRLGLRRSGRDLWLQQQSKSRRRPRFHGISRPALVIIISRFLPIIAPIAMAASLGAKKSTPFTLGTLRDDTPTFAFLLLGTVLIIGALLFLPVAALGPMAEHLGPIPFGG